MRLALSVLLALPLGQGVFWQSSAWADGVDVRGNVYCHRGGEEVPAPNVLVVDHHDRSKRSASSLNGAYRLSFRSLKEVANQDLYLEFWPGASYEPHTWPLKREQSSIWRECDALLVFSHGEGMQCDTTGNRIVGDCARPRSVGSVRGIEF